MGRFDYLHYGISLQLKDMDIMTPISCVNNKLNLALL